MPPCRLRWQHGHRRRIAGLGFGEKVHLPALGANADLTPVALWHPRLNVSSRPAPPMAFRVMPTGNSTWGSARRAIVVPHRLRPDMGLLGRPCWPASICCWRSRWRCRPIRPGSAAACHRAAAVCRSELRVPGRAVDHAGGAAAAGRYVGIPVGEADWLMSSRADANRGWNWYSQASQGGGVIERSAPVPWTCWPG